MCEECAQEMHLNSESEFTVWLSTKMKFLQKLLQARNRDERYDCDILQDTYMKAWAAFRRGKGPQRNPEAWLSKILRHECMNSLRRKQRRQEIFLDSSEENGEGNENRFEETLSQIAINRRSSSFLIRKWKRKLVQAFRGLPERDYRQIVVWRFCHQNTLQEIKGKYGTSINTIRDRLNNFILPTLRRHLLPALDWDQLCMLSRIGWLDTEEDEQ